MVLSASEELMLTLTAKFGFTVVVIVFDVAGLPDAHVSLEVRMTFTWSPFASEVVVYVALLVPTSTLFFFHWYEGDDPPLVGVAVNVTEVPAQIVLSASDELILTLTGKFAFTVVVIVFDVAGFPVVHASLEVRITFTWSPLASPVVVYVALFVPTSILFFFH
jgi:hypothetical protein